MKVLLLPNNVASEISIKVRALKSIGVDARGLADGGHPFQMSGDIKILSLKKGDYITNRLKKIQFYKLIYDWIKWADILHWVWDFGAIPFGLDRKIVERFDKPGVIQWCGSDIRIPEKTFEVNKFYQEAFLNGYEYQFESYEKSLATQRSFAQIGFYPLEIVGMDYYVDKNLFPKRYKTFQSVILSEHPAAYPSLEKNKPLIVHSPSAPVAKGTKWILKAVEQLKLKYNFDFTLVHGMSRSEALEIMKECDIYIDQLIGGSHGLASIEAMAFGKPVVCYINPAVGENYPPDLPIVNANPDNIAEKLEILIKDAALRHELGKKSRNYVEKYHDEKKVAEQLVETYREVIRLHKEKREKV